MSNVDLYLGMHNPKEQFHYNEAATHAAGESAGHWKRSQQVAKRLRERAGHIEHDPSYPAGLWVALELRKLADEIEGG